MNLGVYSPNPADGTSLVRAMMPLGMLTREHPALRLVTPRFDGNMHDLSWDWLAQCDAVLLQRVFDKRHINCAVTAKMLGVPVWMDWDDDLRYVEISNPVHGTYANPELPKNLQTLVELADIITVSVPELGRRMNAPDKTLVIPNAFNDYLFNFDWPKRERRVLWRGSSSHDADLLSVLPALTAVANDPRYRAWEWVFLGEPPWFVLEALPKDRVLVQPFSSPFLFFRVLKHLAPTVMIAPIKNTPFNRAKSNLGWIEGTMAGAAVLGPDMEEWKQPGITNYTDAADFEKQLRGLLDFWDGPKVYPQVIESKRFIEDNLMLSDVNQARWEVLQRLMAMRGRGADKTLEKIEA